MGTIRSRYSRLPETYDIACPHCGHMASRTEWQKENRFHCWECGKDSDEPVVAPTEGE